MFKSRDSESKSLSAFCPRGKAREVGEFLRLLKSKQLTHNLDHLNPPSGILMAPVKRHRPVADDGQTEMIEVESAQSGLLQVSVSHSPLFFPRYSSAIRERSLEYRTTTAMTRVRRSHQTTRRRMKETFSSRPLNSQPSNGQEFADKMNQQIMASSNL